MSEGTDHQGERLHQRHQLGGIGAAAVVLVGPALGFGLARLISRGTGASSRLLVTAMTSAGNIKSAPSYSHQESSVARGKYAEAEKAYQDHLARAPDDDGGNRAREALRQIKAEKGTEPEPGWRYFSSREIREARAWAKEGGIAVHENIWKSRGRRTCHLLARGEPELLAAARSVGCEDGWVQRTRTVHFDLVEIYLERALRRCGVAGSLTSR